MSTNGSLGFDKICHSMQAYLEGADYSRSILARWNGMPLKSVMAKTENEGTPKEECLQLLIKDLRHLPLGLGWLVSRSIEALKNVWKHDSNCRRYKFILSGMSLIGINFPYKILR